MFLQLILYWKSFSKSFFSDFLLPGLSVLIQRSLGLIMQNYPDPDSTRGDGGLDIKMFGVSCVRWHGWRGNSRSRPLDLTSRVTIIWCLKWTDTQPQPFDLYRTAQISRPMTNRYAIRAVRSLTYRPDFMKPNSISIHRLRSDGSDQMRERVCPGLNHTRPSQNLRFTMSLSNF
jgi:hypothetical protein